MNEVYNGVGLDLHLSRYLTVEDFNLISLARGNVQSVNNNYHKTAADNMVFDVAKSHIAPEYK